MEDKAKAGSLTECEEKAFELFKRRQKQLKSSKPREKLGVFLLGKTGMVERSKQRTTSFRPGSAWRQDGAFGIGCCS